MRVDKLSFEIRLKRRTTRDSSSRRIIRLVPVLTLETHNQTNLNTNACPSSSRRIMRLKYKNGQCNQKPRVPSDKGKTTAKQKYGFVWIISALVASNWSQITFFILANVPTSISNRFSPNFNQINISASGRHFLRLHIFKLATMTKRSGGGIWRKELING